VRDLFLNFSSFFKGRKWNSLLRHTGLDISASTKAKELLIMRPIELLYVIALIALGCEDLVVLNSLYVNSVLIVEALFGIYDVQQEELIGYYYYYFFV
jgi:hypothetical protein